jgi:hypothetical protein
MLLSPGTTGTAPGGIRAIRTSSTASRTSGSRPAAKVSHRRRAASMREVELGEALDDGRLRGDGDEVRADLAVEQAHQ